MRTKIKITLDSLPSNHQVLSRESVALANSRIGKKMKPLIREIQKKDFKSRENASKIIVK